VEGVGGSASSQREEDDPERLHVVVLSVCVKESRIYYRMMEMLSESSR
jgi:hypothetical protein